MSSFNLYSLDELFNLVKQSDESAFNELYERTWEKLYLTARQKLKDEFQAKEIVQDVYIDLWNKRKQREIQHTEAYLAQMLRFKVIDHYRKKKIHLEELDKIEDILQESVGADGLYLESELEGILHTWIDQLPAKRKKIFELYYLDSKSTKEIGNQLKLSTKTVQNQLIISKHSLNLILQRIFFLFFIFFLGHTTIRYDYIGNQEGKPNYVNKKKKDSEAFINTFPPVCK